MLPLTKCVSGYQLPRQHRLWDATAAPHRHRPAMRFLPILELLLTEHPGRPLQESSGWMALRERRQSSDVREDQADTNLPDGGRGRARPGRVAVWARSAEAESIRLRDRDTIPAPQSG